MNTITIDRRCPLCRKYTSVTVEEIGFRAWANGACIQDVLPMVPIREREVLISGLCFQCQNDFFDTEEDEEEYEDAE